MKRNSKMNIYFTNSTTTKTTIVLLLMVGFIVYSIWSRNSIRFWGRRSLIVAVFGLIICTYAATRDGLDKTIQSKIDGSCSPGLFSLTSVPFIIGCIGAGLILTSLIATPLCKSQHTRQIWFYIMSGGVMIKIIIVEIARILRIV